MVVSLEVHALLKASELTQKLVAHSTAAQSRASVQRDRTLVRRTRNSFRHDDRPLFPVDLFPNDFEAPLRIEGLRRNR